MTLAALLLLAAGAAAQADGSVRSTIDARFRPQQVVVDFALGEEERSSLVVELVPDDGTAAPLVRELSLRFESFEGAAWRWSVRSRADAGDASFDAAGRSATATPLTQVPEPKGLQYSLAFTFQAGGGVEVALADGSQVMAAQWSATTPWVMTVRPGGALHGLAVGAITPLGDAKLAEALERAPAAKPGAAAPTHATDGASRFVAVAEFAPREVEAISVARPLDPRTAPEGTIERWLLEPRPNVELPTIAITPAKPADGAPVALLFCAAPEGKAAPAALDFQARLAAAGRIVVACDALDGGERRVNQCYDGWLDPELLLVGSSPAAVAADEIAQVRGWIAAQPFAAGRAVELLLDRAAADALVAGRQLGNHRELALGSDGPKASATLQEVATFGEEWLRVRYESDLYRLALERRDAVEAPDLSWPLLERIALDRKVAAGAPDSIGWTRAGGVGLRAPPAGGRITLCASDFGPRAALHRGLATFADEAEDPSRANDAWIGCGGPLESLDGAVNAALALLETATASSPQAKVRLVGEGSWGVVLLLAAVHAPDRVASLHATDALPSFELLLRRPPDALRADPRFGLLTQGQPAALFRPDVFSRFDLEECALLLRDRGIAVEWRDPVDALRRPLDRHGRLALWPRVRRLDHPPR